MHPTASDGFLAFSFSAYQSVDAVRDANLNCSIRKPGTVSGRMSSLGLHLKYNLQVYIQLRMLWNK
jgi:hypothetical protein